MSFTNNLSTYVQQNPDLMKKAIVNVKTIANFDEIVLRTGLKGGEEIPTVASTIQLQAAGCGWTNSGNTVLNKITLNTDKLELKESLCVEELEATQLSKLMRKGANATDTLVAAETFVSEKQDSLGQAIEQIIWRGSKTGNNGKSAVTGNNALANGVIFRVMQSSASTINVNSSGWSNTVGFTKVQTLENSIPSSVYSVIPYTLYLPMAYFTYYVNSLVNANLFNYPADWMETLTIKHPSAGNITIRGVQGMASENIGILAPTDSIFIGIDGESDQDQFDVFYDKSTDTVKVKAKFRIGTAIDTNQASAIVVAALS